MEDHFTLKNTSLSLQRTIRKIIMLNRFIANICHGNIVGKGGNLDILNYQIKLCRTVDDAVWICRLVYTHTNIGILLAELSFVPHHTLRMQ